MSWGSFERMLDARPSLAPSAGRVVEALRAVPAGRGADPLVIAHHAQVDEAHAFAALGLLLKAGLGAFVIQVLNDRGQAVGEFSSLDETPAAVTDDYGEEVPVEPRNTRIVFRPQWT